MMNHDFAKEAMSIIRYLKAALGDRDLRAPSKKPKPSIQRKKKSSLMNKQKWDLIKKKSKSLINKYSFLLFKKRSKKSLKKKVGKSLNETKASSLIKKKFKFSTKKKKKRSSSKNKSYWVEVFLSLIKEEKNRSIIYGDCKDLIRNSLTNRIIKVNECDKNDKIEDEKVKDEDEDEDENENENTDEDEDYDPDFDQYKAFDPDFDQNEELEPDFDYNQDGKFDSDFNEFEESYDERTWIMNEWKKYGFKVELLLPVLEEDFSMKSLKQKCELLAICMEIIEAHELQEYSRLREIKYIWPNVFCDPKTNSISPWVRKLEEFWKVHSSSFKILPCAKGLVAGPIYIVSKEDANHNPSVEMMKLSDIRYKQLLIEDMSEIVKLILMYKVEWVCIIEKETHFHKRCKELNRLIKERNDNGGKGFGLMITSKGFPDYATIRFVRQLYDQLPNVPFYCLTDADIYGIRIGKAFNDPLSFEDPENFKYGQCGKWIGLRSSESKKYINGGSPFAIKELTDREKKVAKGMTNRKDLSELIRSEANAMLINGHRTYIDASRRLPFYELLPDRQVVDEKAIHSENL